MRNARTSGLTLTAVGLVAVLAACLLAGSPARADELRGWWVDAWHAGFLNKSQVDSLLGVPGNAGSKGAIRESNCNAVFVQVRRRADVCYPSGVGEPYFSSGLSPSNFNALQAIINAAHDTTGGKQRIAVHAWIVTFATSASGATPPAQSIYYQHNDPNDPANYWVTLNDSGSETDDKAFDPGHPRCAQYLTDVCMDLVTNFDVDGVHFDYIRFTGNNQGHNPTSVARYNARYGLSGQPLSSSEQFKQWRRDQVTNLVRKVYANIQYVKPQVLLSGAFVTWNPSPANTTRSAFRNTRPYYDVYSDWDAWLTEGIIDMAVPMNYYNWASLPADYTRWMNFIKDAPDRGANRHVINGPGVYLNSLSNAINEILMSRDPSPAGNRAQGWCGYSYAVPYSGGSWGTFSTSLVNQVTPTQAAIPPMPWKTSPTRGHAMGTVTYASTGDWADGAVVAVTGPESRTRHCDGTGFYAFIDLAPGTYTVTASAPGYPVSQAQLAVSAGQMHKQDLVLGGGAAPTVSNVQVTGITNTEATITWTTDQASTSRVEYGLSNSYGYLSEADPAQVAAHSMTLESLQPNTLYHFRVISGNSNGSTTSDDYTFRTAGPPQITNIQAVDVRATSATITWTTNSAADSAVYYGLSSSYGSQVADGSAVTSHSITLTGLTPGSSYHYQVVSANAYGTTASGDFTFNTAGKPIISGVLATGIASSSATIRWATDVPADSLVEYGLTDSYGSSTALDSTEVTSHSVAVSGLQANTTYHYRVRSANAAGTTYSEDYTFKTTVFAGEIIVDGTDGVGFTFELGAWTIGTASAHIGSDYFWAFGTAGSEPSDATNKARWTPTVPVAGTYDVYIYYAQGTNRSTSSYWRIKAASGTSTYRVDQTTGGGAWRLLANGARFGVGTSGYVELWNNSGAPSKVVQGDAVRFVFTGGDATPPSVPDGLTPLAVAPTAVQLSWSPSTDDTGVAGYNVLRDGVQIASTPEAAFGDSSGLLPNTAYTYQVSAYDSTGNTSQPCPGVACVTLSVPPSALTVTCSRATGTWYKTDGFTFTAVGGFGPGRLSKYRYAWDNSPVHDWGTGAEADWSSGTLVVTAGQGGSRYLHVRGFNADGVPNGDLHLGPYRYDPTPPHVLSVSTAPYTTSTSSLEVSWTGSDAESGIHAYEYSVGTQPGDPDIRDWTGAGTAQSAVINGLALQVGDTFYVNVRATNGSGLVSEVLYSSGTTVALPVASAGEARSLPDGAVVAIPGQRVTAAFGGFFYAGARGSGIRVESAEAVSVDHAITVYGVLTLADGCERALTSAYLVKGEALEGDIAASTTIRDLGGSALNAFTPGVTGASGLNNVGLLVRIAGRVTHIADDGFYCDDGSEASDGSGVVGVRVRANSEQLPSLGSMVTVTGISSCRLDGQTVLPLVLARTVTEH